jgi:hypothetical protein
MSTLKIGFHGGPGGNHDGIGVYYSLFDAAGIPFVIKSVDHYGHCFEASQYSNADHVIVFRLSTAGQNDGYDYDVPLYSATPLAAADLHWFKTLAKLPPEFNKDKVWLEVINEVDKNRAEWLAEFAYEIALKALAGGYKVALFGWSSGEPEKAHWQGPKMLEFLRLCDLYPDRLAVALHEYSYIVSDILDGYPYKVGRYHLLHQVCDENDIGRPAVLITEWGWEMKKVPEVNGALNDVDFVAKEYALHKNILGAAIWGLLDYQSSQLANLTQKLIVPVTNLALNTVYPDPIDPPDDGEETMSLVTVKFYSPTELLSSQEILPPEGTVMVTTDVLLGMPATPPPDDSGGDGDNEPVPPVTPPSVVINDIVDTLPKHSTLSYSDRAGGEDDVTAITIHHTVSGSSLADITAIAGYHVNTKGWAGIAYHYCITADGQIYQTNRLVTKSAHSGGNNHYAIGIAILGDFTNKQPSALQLASCEMLVDYLIGERLKKVNHIWGHRDMPTAPDAGTQCPGNTYLDWIGPIANKPLPLPSTKFNGGDAVKVVSSSALNLRATPFGSVLASYPSGTELIVSHPYSVKATGFVWWAVDVAGNKGWVAEDYIALVGSSPSPIGELIDVTPYFVPSGQYGSKIVMKTGSSTQPIQLEKRAGDVILRKGDGNWIDNVRYQDSEQWKVEGGQVKKGIDTSDAGNGGRDAYDLGWAQWIPQFVQVGQTYNSIPTVRRFNRVDCQTISTSQANDYLYVKAIIPTWVSPANPSIVLSDVLIVEWRSGTPDLSIPPNETYYFAKSISYVGWNDNFVVEITQGQAPLSGALDCGL